jgi:phage terminase small subunit
MSAGSGKGGNVPEEKPKKLTLKQERFCQEIVVDWNAAAAARRAGYSKATAKQIATENLSKPYLLERIKVELDRLSKRAEMDAEEAIRETALIARSRIDSYLDFGPDGITLKDLRDMTDDEIAAIGEVSETVSKDGGSLRFKLGDKLKALDQLHRIHGSYNDRVEHTGSVEVAVKEVEFAYPEEEE